MSRNNSVALGVIMCMHERVLTHLFCATPWLWFPGQLPSFRTSQYYTQKKDNILALCTYLQRHVIMIRVWLSIHVACGGFVSLSMVNPQPAEHSPLRFNGPQNLLPIEICTYHHRPGEAPLRLFVQRFVSFVPRSLYHTLSVDSTQIQPPITKKHTPKPWPTQWVAAVIRFWGFLDFF